MNTETAIKTSLIKEISHKMMEVEGRLFFLELKLFGKANFNPNQPRIPAGQPDGGQWTETFIAQAPERMKTSSKGIHLISKHEGYRKTAYTDEAGFMTIGYGHKLLPGEIYPNGLTKSEALTLLSKDIVITEKTVKSRVKVKLYQNQFDALVSLVYNIGSGNFSSSTLLRLLNQENYEEAANQFLIWNKVTTHGTVKESEGLTNRRKREREYFLGNIR